MLNEKKDSSVDLTIIQISSNGTHHILNDKPLYKTRFLKVLSFHKPGIAAVLDKSGAYHINLKGVPIYNKRFKTAFGYYQGLAAVCDEERMLPHRSAWKPLIRSALCLGWKLSGGHGASL